MSCPPSHLGLYHGWLDPALPQLAFLSCSARRECLVTPVETALREQGQSFLKARVSVCLAIDRPVMKPLTKVRARAISVISFNVWSHLPEREIQSKMTFCIVVTCQPGHWAVSLYFSFFVRVCRNRKQGPGGFAVSETRSQN